MDVSKGRDMKLVITCKGRRGGGEEREKKLVIYCLYNSQQRKQEKIINCYKTNIATGHMIVSTKTQLLKMVWICSLYTMAVRGGDG